MKPAHRQALTMVANSREGASASILAAHGFDDKLQAELVDAELARRHSIRVEADDRTVEVIHITITDAGIRALAGRAQDIAAVDEPKRGPASSSHKAPTVSIIDDDVLVRDALQSLIQSLGYGAVTFESADDFLQSGQIAETACLILDVQMPGMGGLELQDRLLAEGRDTPVIFITALPGKLLRARALDAGALGFLRKPVHAEHLIECLNVAFAGVERRIASPAIGFPHSVPLASGRQEGRDHDFVTFAAASMRDVLSDVNTAFTRASRIKVTANYDASSVLIKEIEAGAFADVFVSACVDWMDYGVRQGLIRDDTRINLLGNQLVLIAPKSSTLEDVRIGAGFNFAKLAGDGRIAIRDVRGVPVGLYAKAALEKLGAWASAEPKMAMTKNARAALTLVARREAPLGIVYATDARLEPRVKVIGTFPQGCHRPIVYSVAATRRSKPDVVQYLDFLRTRIAETTFAAYNFSVLASPSS